MYLRTIRIGVILSLLAIAPCARAADAPAAEHLVLPPAESPAGPIQALRVLHEGLQLTYSSITSSIPGDVDQVIKAIPGTLEDPNSGWTVYTKKTHSTIIAGPMELTIARIAGDQIVVVNDLFILGNPFLPADAPPAMGPRLTDIEHAGDGTLNSGHWLEPAQLEQFLKTPPAGAKAVRGPWKVKDHTFDAIIFTIQLDKMELMDAYDAKTGLLLHRGSISQGPPPAFVAPGEIPHGNALLNFQDLAAVRDLDIPWAGEPAPKWVNQTKVLHYQGQSAVGRMPQIAQGWDMTIKEVGDGWVHTETTRTVANRPTSDRIELYWGSAEFGGLWAGPAALAKLQKGQVLDDDPITKTQTSVTFADDKSVAIGKTNMSGEVDWSYDKATGMLLGQRTVTQSLVPVVRTDVEEHHLIGKE